MKPWLGYVLASTFVFALLGCRETQSTNNSVPAAASSTASASDQTTQVDPPGAPPSAKTFPVVEATPEPETISTKTDTVKPYWKGEPRNLVLITLDTTRADHLSCYGKIKDLTPRMDAFAESGALFLNSFAQVNQTNPSHVSIMSGVMALDHMVTDNKEKIRVKTDLLPEAFKRIGYSTAGFPSFAHVSAELGWRGFDEIEDIAPEMKNYHNAQQITDKAIHWLDRNGDKPFFIWVHYWDAHVPYIPPPQFAKKFYTGDPKAGDGPELRKQYPSIEHHTWLKGVKDIEYPRAMYKAEINFVDGNVGRIIDYLRKRNLTSKTGVIIVGDHGESLGEHEMYFNHTFAFENALRVPLIIRMPGFPSGVKVAESATHLDIMPTLAQLYGLTIHNDLKGISLVPSLQGQSDPNLIARTFFIHEGGNARQVIVRDGNLKVFYTMIRVYQYPPMDVLENEVWMFDLSKDPNELHDISKDHPDLVDKYRKIVEPWFEAKHKWLIQRVINRKAEGFKFSPKKLKALKELGYIDDDEEDDGP